MNLKIEDNINSLNLNEDIVQKLNKHEIYCIKELWESTRTDLRNYELTNKDISEIIIKLQLLGLDLNKKLY